MNLVTEAHRELRVPPDCVPSLSGFEQRLLAPLEHVRLAEMLHRVVRLRKQSPMGDSGRSVGCCAVLCP